MEFHLKTLILTILITLFIQADGDIELKFKDDYKSALQEAKRDKKYLFVLVTTKNCGWCRKLKKTTLQEVEIKESLDSDYITVELDRDGSYYPTSMKIEGVPSVFIIDPNSGEIIKRIVGFRENKNDYTKWFRYVKILEE